MPNGYSWRPIFRQVPENGSAVSTDVKLAFSDAGGATQIRLRYALDQERKEDVNRVARTITFGYRFESTLRFEIFTMTDQQYLADIVNRLVREDWDSYFSLDAGATEQLVEVTDYRGPDAIRGRTIAGASFEVGIRGRELMDEVPYIAATYADPLLAAPLMTLPTASAFYKGQGRVLEGAVGVEDVWYVCIKNQSNNYLWVPVAAGGP